VVDTFISTPTAISKKLSSSEDDDDLDLNSPLTSNVTLLGSLTFSTNVYFSSPSVCSYTRPA